LGHVSFGDGNIDAAEAAGLGAGIGFEVVPLHQDTAHAVQVQGAHAHHSREKAC
jgi:hypothetical protein